MMTKIITFILITALSCEWAGQAWAGAPDKIAPRSIFQPAPVLDAPERIRDILVSWRNRPEPLEAGGFSVEDIRRGERLAFGTDNVDRYLRSVTFLELENVLPYLFEIVRKILEEAEGYESILVVGRDAELIYDSLKVVLKGTRDEDKAVLFPGSMKLLYFLLSQGTGGRELIGNFLRRFGITADSINFGKRFLMIDTGFGGSACTRLKRLIEMA